MFCVFLLGGLVFKLLKHDMSLPKHIIEFKLRLKKMKKYISNLRIFLKLKALTLSSFLIFSCGSLPVKYVAPADSDFKMIFTMNDSAYSQQGYSMYFNEKCIEDVKTRAVASMLKVYGIGGKPKEVLAKSGRRVYIDATMGTHMSYEMVVNTCSSMISFIPEKGKIYHIEQTGCDKVFIQDIKTKKAPISLKEHDACEVYN